MQGCRCMIASLNRAPRLGWGWGGAGSESVGGGEGVGGEGGVWAGSGHLGGDGGVAGVPMCCEDRRGGLAGVERGAGEGRPRVVGE